MSRLIGATRKDASSWLLEDNQRPRKNNVYIVAADASRRAALLVACIRPVCALLAPCRAGASTPIVTALFRSGSLEIDRVVDAYEPWRVDARRVAPGAALCGVADAVGVGGAVTRRVVRVQHVVEI